MQTSAAINDCSAYFRQYEQQLEIKLDDKIVRSQDELLYRIQKLEKSNQFLSNMFNHIEEWKTTAISKVEKTAERVRHKLNEQMYRQRIAIMKQLEVITEEARSRRQEENFIENDIDRLKRKLNAFYQILK